MNQLKKCFAKLTEDVRGEKDEERWIRVESARMTSTRLKTLTKIRQNQVLPPPLASL